MRRSDGRSRHMPALILCCVIGMLLLLAPGLATGSAAAASNSKETATKSGGKKKDPPINIESAKLDYYDKEQKLVYAGDVVAVQGDITLKTPMLVVYLTPKDNDAGKGPPASASEMRRWEASGPVTFISKDQVATGDSATYEKAENKVFLNGNVTLTQNDYVTKGDHCIYNVDDGRAVVTGHVRSMFPPKNNNSDQTSKKDEEGTRKSGKSPSKLEAKSKTP